jgi:hypothetical protein
LVAAAVAVLVAVGRLHHLELLLLAVVEAVALVEPSYGYLLLTLAPLRQSLWALAAQEVLLDLPMIQADFPALVEANPCLGLGHMFAAGVTV